MNQPAPPVTTRTVFVSTLWVLIAVLLAYSTLMHDWSLADRLTVYTVGVISHLAGSMALAYILKDKRE